MIRDFPKYLKLLSCPAFENGLPLHVESYLQMLQQADYDYDFTACLWHISKLASCKKLGTSHVFPGFAHSPGYVCVFLDCQKYIDAI